MQPYFIPYAGYFRLLTQSDLFVIYDCVQFPRRGWVHRNRLFDANGEEKWLTLPLLKAPQDVFIQDLRFPVDASPTLAERLRPFPLPAYDPELRSAMMDVLLATHGTVVDYIARVLRFVADHLGLSWSAIRSSSLQVPESFRGQDRIIEIVRRLGSHQYVNAPGGRALYDPEAFAEAGIVLDFLPPYPGPNASILTRILTERPEALALDIRAVPAPMR
jgi:WbqC-like protein family